MTGATMATKAFGSNADPVVAAYSRLAVIEPLFDATPANDPRFAEIDREVAQLISITHGPAADSREGLRLQLKEIAEGRRDAEQREWADDRLDALVASMQPQAAAA